jgi:putative aldouronate transport system substrate-binding protein
VQDGVCISTACENVDILIKAMDFSFTEEGALLSNYGIENVSYNIGADGKPQWAEAMTTAQDRTFRAAIIPYIFTGLPTCNDVTKYWSETFDEESYNALNMWTDTPTDKAYDLPSALYFTTEESTVYAVTVTDVETYANEYILTSITGNGDIDATWDDYVNKVWSLGLQQCIDAEQCAYERYLERSAT